MTTLDVGSVLADRYELLEPLRGDEATDRFRALDRRLRREVVVEVERTGGARVPTAVGVRTLAGAEDTAGMQAILDGGDAGGQHFVVRDLPRGSFDDTGVLHTGPTTAVLPVASAPLVLPDPEPLPAAPPPSRVPRGTRRLGLALAAAAAAVVLLALAFAWGGDGLDGPLDTTTTVGVEGVDPIDTPIPTKPKQVEATPTTEAPTTTVTEVVSDPEETDQLPEGFPFEETGPPGKAKKAKG